MVPIINNNKIIRCGSREPLGKEIRFNTVTAIDYWVPRLLGQNNNFVLSVVK